MSVQSTAPRYMAQLLEELGWNQGTRIPLANAENQILENLLISRQNEIQHLKENVILQQNKRNDLNKYIQNVQTEYQENTRLLFAHKQQLEQEVKLRQLAVNEADRLDRDVLDCQKQSKEIGKHLERFHADIARHLKKADTMKTEVCGERGALQEWRAALERSSCDIAAIEQFTKQDISMAKAMEYKRQKLKVEHDRTRDRLNQLVSDLAAEERGCERISTQVIEGMEQRKQMMSMWSNAVENLRQRDTDIRHIREDYEVLETEANKIAEQCREQQAFCDQQHSNNTDAIRENITLAHKLSQTRITVQHLLELNQTMESEEKSLQRELSNMQNILERHHLENKHIMDDQHKKDKALSAVNNTIQELKVKLTDSLDKSKSSERRAKLLEDILNDEERYASQLTVNQQRAMHCSFTEQQKLLVLKNEEKLFHMQLRANKAIMDKLDSKQQTLDKELQSQKESLYCICYQVETIGARVAYMEGARTERECSAVLVEKENRLKDVCALHAARVSVLERHSARLHDDMRRLARELESKGIVHNKLKSRLKSAMLNVEGSEKELHTSRDLWRRERVEEALMRLKVAHAARAVAGLGDTAFTLDKQRLQLDAAMNERLVEISARRDLFSVQKRALLEDCSKLTCEIREREQRIDQLKKRYDIFIASLGKDDSGQQLSVTFFKIKFAAERAELRERGAALDADIGRRERDVSALEATLRVVHAAHAHFMHHISPLAEDTPEIAELRGLTKSYYEMRDELKGVHKEIVNLEDVVADQNSRLNMLTEKNKQLTAREAEAENDLEYTSSQKSRQMSRLSNSRDVVRAQMKRLKKLVEGVDDWRIFQLALWVRDYAESHHSALHALSDLFSNSPEQFQHFAALVASTDIQQHLTRQQRGLHSYIQRIVSAVGSPVKESAIEIDESVFSPSSESVRSGVSIATGYTRRLATFRRDLADKVQETALCEEIPELVHRSTISLRVVTVGIEEPIPRGRTGSLQQHKFMR